MATQQQEQASLSERLLPAASNYDNVAYVSLDSIGEQGEEQEGVQVNVIADENNNISDGNGDGDAISNGNRSKPAAGGGAQRIFSMDLLRGFIMIIMSWDHCKDFLMLPPVTGEHGLSEGWDGPIQDFNGNPIQFLARKISHICAPGFFFTMGCSIVLFALSRMDPKKPVALRWTIGQVVRYFALRGLVLLGVGRLVGLPYAMGRITDVYMGRNVTDWHGNEFGPGDEYKMLFIGAFGVYQVMTALGLSLMTAAALFLAPMLYVHRENEAANSAAVVTSLQDNNNNSIGNINNNNNSNNEEYNNEKMYLSLGRRVARRTTPFVLGSFFFLAIFAISDAIIINAQGDDIEAYQPWPHSQAKASDIWQLIVRFLFISGAGNDFFQMIAYPMFPWVGLTALGMGFGFLLRKDARAAHSRVLKMGFFFIILFVFVRLFAGPFGNFRGSARGEHGVVPGIWDIQMFFTVSKYPPSFAYALITMGVNFVVMWVLSRDYFSDVQTATRHVAFPLLVFGRVPLFFYVAHHWCYSVVAVVIRVLPRPVEGFTMLHLLAPWLCVLLFLFPCCIRYYAFKSTKPSDSLWRFL